MSQIRLGIIGLGSMADVHIKGFEKIEGMRLTAVCDTAMDRVQRITEQQRDVRGYTDPRKFLASDIIDAVLIVTPHKFHPQYAIAAFERGLHVLTEKPVAVTAADALAMNQAHAQHPELIYSVMFQMRTDPLYRKVKQMIESGRVGKLLRVNWVVTTWMRTQAYYNSGSWRATWEGEGGGVLLNQCPHNLDLLCWLVGMPTQVVAQIGVGKYHKIEVEDEVNALLTFEGGATGSFITNTAESPGVNRLEIVGDLGTIIAQPGGTPVLTYYESAGSVSEFIATTPQAWGKIASNLHAITPAATDWGHHCILQNFINAIRHREALIAPGEDGLMSLELSNAMLLSGFNHSQPVNLPTDHAAFDKLLNRLIAQANQKKK
ncbi:MAG: Gfo/Idh/MocA family oxidoreductase [Phycisphaeraceae bacterium]|nr:Gfo/Idh/MocA family oxidoreductase [Phycisphaeraceae bacterium]